MQVTMMKKLFLIPVFAALFSFGSAAHAQVDQSNPQALIKTATQQVLDEVKQQTIKQGDTNRIITIVNKDILPYTDFRRTTQLAMGRNWRTASAEQQQQIQEQFKLLLIRTYSGALAQLKPGAQQSRFDRRYAQAKCLRSLFRGEVFDVAQGKNGAESRWKPLNRLAQDLGKLRLVVVLLGIGTPLGKVTGDGPVFGLDVGVH